VAVGDAQRDPSSPGCRVRLTLSNLSGETREP
jgi:hypothetical protein